MVFCCSFLDGVDGLNVMIVAYCLTVPVFFSSSSRCMLLSISLRSQNF
jgi:hypothetical protein